MKKKILMLGGSNFQVPAIKYAVEQGHYVITCDFLPDNPGHTFSHEYHNVSTTDNEQVLELARKLNIDGIVAYASDPAAPTAAYVGNQLGLPSNPYISVLTLARKDLFRSFLEKNGFNVPEAESFYEYNAAEKFFDKLKKPVMVKPVDSSGSKGVSKIVSKNQLMDAFNYALSFSREKKVIIEEYIERKNYQIAGDGFVVDGNLVFRCFANEHFDKLCNPLVPIGESFPSIESEILLQKAHEDIQKILSLLNYKFGALNFDFLFDKNGELYLLEIGPRNGGNLIPEVIKYVTDIDLIKYTIEAALGYDCRDLGLKKATGFYSSYILHSLEEGIVKEVYVSNEIKNNIIEQNIFVNKGDRVYKFNGSNHTLGSMILRFDSKEEMLNKMDNMENYIKVVVSK